MKISERDYKSHNRIKYKSTSINGSRNSQYNFSANISKSLLRSPFKNTNFQEIRKSPAIKIIKNIQHTQQFANTQPNQLQSQRNTEKFTNMGIMIPIRGKSKNRPYNFQRYDQKKKIRLPSGKRTVIQLIDSKRRQSKTLHQQILSEMNHYFKTVGMYSYINQKKQKNSKQTKRFYKTQQNSDIANQSIKIQRLQPRLPSESKVNISKNKTCTENIYNHAHTSMQIQETKVIKVNKQKQKAKILSRKIKTFKNQQKISYLINIFGSLGQLATPQQINRLKILYYKDFLWKINFNQSINIIEQTKAPRYFIGKGNNSKLIKLLMKKRFWWYCDPRQQNANFIWTQLKVHSLYHNQQKGQKVNNFQLQSQEFKEYRRVIHDKSALILTETKYKQWTQYIEDYLYYQRKTKQQFANRKLLIQKYKNLSQPKRVTNHLQFSRLLGNKKSLYNIMSLYYRITKKFSYLPATYVLENGIENEEYLNFLQHFYKLKKEGKFLWIVKPGELSNRGQGIKVCYNIQQIKQIIKSKKKHANGTKKTYIIQQYIQKPLLYKERKFDIRHYIMISSSFGRIKGYYYEQGYIRTTSYKYNIQDNNRQIHLTNDAVQKCCKDYEKYQKGNKLSYHEFNQYLLENYKQIDFFKHIIPKIREISIDVINGAYYFIDPKRRINNFQIFGLDIMLDQSFNAYLIQVNTNPCLEFSSPLLAKLITHMVNNSLMLTIDTIYPPPSEMFQISKKIDIPENALNQNKFELVFDQIVDGRHLNEQYKLNNFDINQYGSDQQAYESNSDENE